jgi:iron complex outermembrane receptor protein
MGLFMILSPWPVFLWLMALLLLSPFHAAAGTVALTGEDPPADQTESSREGTWLQTASVTLDDIVVQAEREGPPQTDTSLTRIDREDVNGPLSKGVAEALERDPSIFRFRDGRGEQGILMRGFEQRQLLVLMDGVPLYNAYDRGLDLGRIPMGPVNHITLVKGAGSIAYGPNGLGGAINITTRRPGEGPLLEGEFASSPEDDAYRFRLGSDKKLKSFAYHLDVGGVIEDGYHLSDRFTPGPNEDGGRRENSDTDNYNVSGKIGWDVSNTHRIQAGGFFLKGDWGVPPNAYTARPRYWRWSLWEDVNGHLGHVGRYGAFSMEETLYVNLNTTELDSYDDGSYGTQNTRKAFHSRHEDATFGATLRPSYAFDRFPLPGKAYARAWVGARYDRHEERPTLDATKTTFSVYTVTIAPEIELEPWEKLALIAGLQADIEIPEKLEGFAPKDTYHVGPMFQVFYKPEEPVFLKFQATQRARFPTLKERYSSTLGGRLPNPQLRPETAWNLGLDGGYREGAVHIVAGGFYSDVTDLIEQTVQPGGEEQIDNVGGVQYLGAEAMLEWTLGWGFLLRVDYAYLHYERGASDESLLPYRPAHKGSAGLTYAWKEWLDASTIVRAVSAQDFQDPDTGRWGRLGAYSLWDAFLRVRPIRNLSVWLNVENLLDADYQNAYGFPEPGRTFWIGIRGHVG